MNFCPSCGAKKLREQDRFCMNCGEPYPVVEPPKPAAPAAEADPVPPPAKESPAPETPAEGIPAAPAATHVQPSPLAASLDGTRVVSAQPVAHAAPVARQQPITPEAPETDPVQDAALATQPMVQAGPDVAAEATALRDSIDKMLGSEEAAPASGTDSLFEEPVKAPVQQKAGQPASLFDTAVLDEPPQPEAQTTVFDAVPFDEGEFPAAAEESFLDAPFEEAAFEEFPAGQADLFEGPVDEGGDNLFAAPVSTPRQQPAPRAEYEPETRQFYDEPAPRQAAGDTQGSDKWQRLGQGGDIQSMYEQAERRRPPEIPLPEYAEEREYKRRSPGRTVAFVLVTILVFVVGTLGATMGMLYYQNRPGKTIDAFMEALEDGNFSALQASVALEGVSGTTEGWQAFVNAFDTAAAQKALEDQLKVQASSGAKETDQYAAVQLEGESLFLFVKRYAIKIQAVDLLAQGFYDGEITINGSYLPGEQSDNGLLYPGVMPGRYNYYMYAGGEEVLRGEIDAFAVASANILANNGGGSDTDAGAERATVTVGNCLSDDAILYVAGVQVEAKPVGGTVTIPDVAVGNEIRIVATVDGAQREARVVFSDLSQTSLSFGEYSAAEAEEAPAASEDSAAAQQAASMTASDVNAVLESFYRSYLQSINDQSVSLNNSTGANTTAMESRITSDNNKAYLFEYVGVNADAASLEAGEVGGKPAVTFTATFSYRYTPRDDDGDTQDGSNRQVVQIVYEDGEWKVNSMAFEAAE